MWKFRLKLIRNSKFLLLSFAYQITCEILIQTILIMLLWTISDDDVNTCEKTCNIKIMLKIMNSWYIKSSISYNCRNYSNKIWMQLGEKYFMFVLVITWIYIMQNRWMLNMIIYFNFLENNIMSFKRIYCLYSCVCKSASHYFNKALESKDL